MDAEEAEAIALFDAVESVAREVLLAAGYHRHKRGDGRKRRGNDGSIEGEPNRHPRGRAERIEVLTKAQEGDASVLPQLRAILREDDSPYVELMGNMAAIVERTLCSGLFGKNLGAKEALVLKLARLRDELAGAEPTPIERLLAERTASCWLIVYEYERQYANAGQLEMRQAEFHQRRIDAAHRRFLSSLKTLATIRRLAIPAIQVNVAEKQVNVVNRG